MIRMPGNRISFAMTRGKRETIGLEFSSSLRNGIINDGVSRVMSREEIGGGEGKKKKRNKEEIRFSGI